MRIESSLCMSVGLKVMPAVGSTPKKRPTNSLPVIFIPNDDRVCVVFFAMNWKTEREKSEMDRVV